MVSTVVSRKKTALMYCPTVIHVGRVQTRLQAHHVNKKITKRMMDRRPKKSRPSDINRNNVNLNKCITKIQGASSEYTLISGEGASFVLNYWCTGRCKLMTLCKL
jgi:dephospho-CoA kinase